MTGPELTVEQVVAALRAHPEGATLNDIRRAATPGREDIRAQLEEWGGRWDDPLSGPAVWRETWPDDVGVKVAIDAARRAGWLIRAERPGWDQSRMAEMVTHYYLDGRAPLPVREPGRMALVEGVLTVLIRAVPLPEPTPEQLALPLPDRVVAFLIAAGGGGTPLSNIHEWSIPEQGDPERDLWLDAVWRRTVAELEERGYRVDWWPGTGDRGWVRLATLPPVTVGEAARMLGVSYPRAYNLLRERKLKMVDRVGRSPRYRYGDVAALAAEDRRPGPRPKMSQPPPSGA